MTRSNISAGKAFDCAFPFIPIATLARKIISSISMSLAMRSSVFKTALRSTARRGITTHAQLPSEHKMVYEMCRKLADEEIAPNAKQWDKEHIFPTEAITKLVRIE
jgi:alkylation response protein AidB-like acyl-CoA dehydrogenase